MRSLFKDFPLIAIALSLCMPPGAVAQTQPSGSLFGIQVVDDQTQRGVPLVELTTVSGVRFVTDSAGFVAIDDPALLGHEVFFTLKSAGYEFPPDGLGQRGSRIELTPGGSATLKMHRQNIAERLYRITGEGIYRDSVMLHREAPIHEPLLNSEVVGQDSAQVVVYHDRVRWFFGDTSRQNYPLGQFWTSGATSSLPGAGGLAASVGIDLTYFAGADHFSRPMIAHADNDPLWLDGLMVVNDAEHHTDRLVGVFSKMHSLSRCVGRTLALYDDAKETFEPVMDIPLDAPLYPRGQVTAAKDGATDYRYFGDPIPTVRVRAELASVKDLKSYEAWTPLRTGSQPVANGQLPAMDGDDSGQLKWGWNLAAEPLKRDAQRKLLEARQLSPEQTNCFTRDIETRQLIELHAGSVRWNEFRKCWILIAVQIAAHGEPAPSFLGEVWYSEAPAPTGPFAWARKIVTHDHYSFYNPVQHDFFDTENGRFIYFEGTYSATFSGNPTPTPRYDYNQMMYRLDLSDPRLRLPPATDVTPSTNP